jgi:hypothetical protein
MACKVWSITLRRLLVYPESVVDGQYCDLYHDMSWAKRWHVVCMGWFMLVLVLVRKVLGELNLTSPVQFLPTIQVVHEGHANNDHDEARSERQAVVGKLVLKIIGRAIDSVTLSSRHLACEQSLD